MYWQSPNWNSHYFKSPYWDTEAVAIQTQPIEEFSVGGGGVFDDGEEIKALIKARKDDNEIIDIITMIIESGVIN